VSDDLNIINYNLSLDMNDKDLDHVVQHMFKKYDENKNGSLDVKEIEKFLNEAYAEVGRKPSNFSEAQDLVKMYDRNKDGTIDKKEFKEILKKILNMH
jgi:Ca2+-binding EF-hand superfamily protein